MGVRMSSLSKKHMNLFDLKKLFQKSIDSDIDACYAIKATDLTKK